MKKKEMLEQWMLEKMLLGKAMFEKKRELRLRRISEEELGPSRAAFVNIFNTSHDPYLSGLFQCPAEPVTSIIKKEREKTGKKITVHHVMNKIIAIIATKMPNIKYQSLGGKVYEILDIAISNPFMVPETDGALASIVIEEPHLKSLEQIHDDFKSEAQRITEEYSAIIVPRQVLMTKLLVNTKLINLVGEKRIFKSLYESGMGSNFMVANNSYGRNTYYLATRFAANPFRAIFRVAIHAAMKIPVVENDQVIIKEIIPIMGCFDHRFLDGSHAQIFGKLLGDVANELDQSL